MSLDLQAIKARYVEYKDQNWLYMSFRWPGVQHAPVDAGALIAEVEKLRAALELQEAAATHPGRVHERVSGFTCAVCDDYAELRRRAKAARHEALGIRP